MGGAGQRRGRTVRSGVSRVLAVLALVGGATLAGATAAHADPPPFGSPYTPQDGVCTGAQSDADCWHYADSYRTEDDCTQAGWALTYGYAGSTACTYSGRAGHTDLWIWMPDAGCPPGATVRQCNGELTSPYWTPWEIPPPVDG